MDWIIHIVIAILAGILIVTFVGQRTVVHQVSMLPTLEEGDNLLVEKLSPRFGTLHKGDIIVFVSPEEDRQLIKRLIAVEGDEVEIKDGKVYVNGEASRIINPYEVETYSGQNAEYSKLVIPAGYVYALGDNRPDSHDSRAFGPIERKSISGRAIFRFLPLTKIGSLK